ncbi:hypothetical protein B0H13DRAFT_2033627 [Mycena leptocephala]|nr:hypothetical protein B0H13DRAFT_2033627 [Mycena leptocephala]
MGRSIGIGASYGLDIHDVNRQKIVIWPRCKEYVQKQKQHSIRTPCFSTTFQNSDENEKTLDHDPNPDADPEPDVAIKDIVTSFAVKDAKKTENSVLERDVHEREIAAHEAPNSITNQIPSVDLVHEESVAQETPGGAAHRTASNGTSGIEQATGDSILGTHREAAEAAPTYGRGAGPPDGRVLCGCFGAIRTLQLWMFGARGMCTMHASEAC